MTEEQTMTSDELREQLIDRAAPPDFVDMVMLYMEGVEDQLETDEFLPGQNLWTSRTCPVVPRVTDP